MCLAYKYLIMSGILFLLLFTNNKKEAFLYYFTSLGWRFPISYGFMVLDFGKGEKAIVQTEIARTVPMYHLNANRKD